MHKRKNAVCVGFIGLEGLESEVHVDGIHLETVSKFKYLGLFYMNQVQMKQNAVGRWRTGGGLQVSSGP